KALGFRRGFVGGGGAQPGKGRARARMRAPARAPERGRLVAGRAADERHDGRRGHAPARVPGDSHRGRDAALGGVDPLPAARRLPFDLAELHGSGRAAGGGRAPGGRAAWLARLDRALGAYERRPLPPLRRLALDRAERWIVRRQEADGSWGGIQPPWVYSLMALHLCGYPLEHPVMRRGLEGLERFMVEDQDDSRAVGAPPAPSRRLGACQSPVWDTALAIIALRDGGVPGDHPALVRAARWLLGEEVHVRGDWAVARPRLEPGGWAFEFANVNYPDVDD